MNLLAKVLKKELTEYRTEIHRVLRKGRALLRSLFLASLIVNVCAVTELRLDLAFIVICHLMGKLWEKRPVAVTYLHFTEGTYTYK